MSLALIPAAGASRRMGRAKLLLPIAGTTVVGATVEALLAGGAAASPAGVCLVVRPEDGPLHRWAAERGLRLAENPAPDRGMLSSILAGLDALGGVEGVAAAGGSLLVCPADLPELAASTVAAVLARLGRGATLAVPVHGGRRGHPLGIAPPRIADLPGLDPEVGLRQLLAAHPDEVAETEVDDPGCLRDVDTPADYDRARTSSS
jgi:molybdenum cofactor cytidylyltransferase